MISLEDQNRQTQVMILPKIVLATKKNHGVIESSLLSTDTFFA
jgi:hypothetical protein